VLRVSGVAKSFELRAAEGVAALSGGKEARGEIGSADISSWPIASFRCRAEFDRFEAQWTLASCQLGDFMRRRRGIRDPGVRPLVKPANTYCTHDLAVYAYRKAAAQSCDAGSDEYCFGLD
jgi:hypothetical protein